MEVPVKSRRTPSLSLPCIVFPDYSSFLVLRETPLTFFCDYFEEQKPQTKALGLGSNHTCVDGPEQGDFFFSCGFRA
jgi:hypothetical protein